MTNLKSSNVLICGYYGQGNGGDEALLLTLLQMLPQAVTPIVLSARPESTAEAYGVTSLNRYDLPKIIATFPGCDWFIWGGGSLMQDSSSWRNPFFYGGLMLLAQAWGLKTLAWAQGVGPLESRWGKFLGKKAFQGCDRVSVRDQGSGALLHSWGLKPAIAPDPVWNLEPDKVINFDLDPNTIAVNLRPHRQLTESRLDLLVQALSSLRKKLDCPLLLLPFHRGGDDRLAEAIVNKLQPSNYNTSVQILKLDDPRQLKAVVGQVRFLIGMRLHSLIMAAAMGCSSFALSYDPKVSQLMTQINLPGWALESLPSNYETIAQHWEHSYHHQKPLNPQQQQLIQGEVELVHQKLLQALV